MSNRRNKKTRRRNYKPSAVDHGQITKRKRLRDWAARRNNIARETRHLTNLETIYTEGLLVRLPGGAQRVVVSPNKLMAAGFKTSRENLLKLAQTIR